MSRILRTTVVLFLAALALTTLASAPVSPDYLPTCGSPQAIAPMALAGGAVVNARSAVVWNGKDFGVAWVDGSDARLYFRRFYADGTPVGPAAMLSSRSGLVPTSPDMVWNGSGYAVVWSALETGYYSIFMVRLDATGDLIPDSEVRLGGPSSDKDSYQPQLAWNGSVYCCVYTYKYAAGSDYDIYATLRDETGGNIVGNLPVCTTVQIQDNPTVAWFPAANRFAVAWDDIRSGSDFQIYGNTINGPLLGGERLLMFGGTGVWTREPHFAVATNNTFIGMVWTDTRNTYTEPYFARYDKNLDLVGGLVRLVSDVTYNTYSPRLYWTGAEFGVFYDDFRGGNRDVWYRTVKASGQPSGTTQQLLFTSASLQSAAAFARRGWLVTAHGNTTYNFVQAVGCNAVTAPPCPENVMAYNVSGDQATLSWLPAQDDSVDTAYYQIYRNNALVGITDDTVYTATGLSLGTTYNFAIRTVNAAQSVSSGCPATSAVYVKTSATLTLMVDKSTTGTDASLSWTDAGFGSYNVFRGTSPQTMSLLDTTALLAKDDVGALTNGVTYFYTVDDPGQ